MNILYSKSHPKIKNFLVSTKSRYLFNKKYGNIFKIFYESLRKDQINADSLASNNLNEFYEFIKSNHIYYRNYFDNFTNIHMDKNTAKKDHSLIKNGNPFYKVYSSGTTGNPICIPYSIEALQKEYAFWWYHRSFGGIKQGDRIATIAGHKVIDVKQKKPPYWVYNNNENQILFSSYHLSNINIKYYIEELNKSKPLLIHGYPSSIYLLALYIINNNILLNFQPKMIVASSETLLDQHRKIIEKAFKTKVYIWYGNTEQCGHITECEYGKLHIQPRHSYVRILDDKNQDVKEGGRGRIVGTNFLNKCFPLINYDTNDYVTLSSNQTCQCKRPGKIIEKIDGRIEDYIITPEKNLIGRLDHLFKHSENVIHAQIEQNNINEIVIHINKNEKYSNKEEKLILDEARERLGKTIIINFDYDTPIIKDNNSKFRFIKQNINIKEILK
jgi:phenylacetate-CoA ligase